MIAYAHENGHYCKRDKSIIEKDQANRISEHLRYSNEQLCSFQDEKADLLVVTLDSPEMTGEMLCTLIRDDKELCNVSIIIVCSDTESDAKRCLQCSANTFITRPPVNAILLQEMHQLLRRSQEVAIGFPWHQNSSGSQATPFTAYAENISVSGMLLHSEALLFEGDAITCSFSLPDSPHSAINAEVMRILEKESEHHTNCYGVKFIDQSIHVSSAIGAFVEGKRDSASNAA
jgi:CheY-like chemotaxis protein